MTTPCRCHNESLTTVPCSTKATPLWAFIVKKNNTNSPLAFVTGQHHCRHSFFFQNVLFSEFRSSPYDILTRHSNRNSFDVSSKVPRIFVSCQEVGGQPTCDRLFVHSFSFQALLEPDTAFQMAKNFEQRIRNLGTEPEFVEVDTLLRPTRHWTHPGKFHCRNWRHVHFFFVVLQILCSFSSCDDPNSSARSGNFLPNPFPRFWILCHSLDSRSPATFVFLDPPFPTTLLLSSFPLLPLPSFWNVWHRHQGCLCLLCLARLVWLSSQLLQWMITFHEDFRHPFLHLGPSILTSSPLVGITKGTDCINSFLQNHAVIEQITVGISWCNGTKFFPSA